MSFRSIKLCVLLASCPVFWAVATSAHEGHGGMEVGAYDLDAPRRVSPVTAQNAGSREEDSRITFLLAGRNSSGQASNESVGPTHRCCLRCVRGEI